MIRTKLLLLATCLFTLVLGCKKVPASKQPNPRVVQLKLDGDKSFSNVSGWQATFLGPDSLLTGSGQKASLNVESGQVSKMLRVGFFDFQSFTAVSDDQNRAISIFQADPSARYTTSGGLALINLLNNTGNTMFEVESLVSNAVFGADGNVYYHAYKAFGRAGFYIYNVLDNTYRQLFSYHAPFSRAYYPTVGFDVDTEHGLLYYGKVQNGSPAQMVVHNLKNGSETTLPISLPTNSEKSPVTLWLNLSPANDQLALSITKHDLDGNDSARISILSLASNSLQVLDTRRFLSDDFYNSINPTWSPDGKRLLYSSLVYLHSGNNNKDVGPTDTSKSDTSPRLAVNALMLYKIAD